ncbi:hypothetical protein, partial [Paracoccus nototheniae]|uniref:hypothetical protein n=1 Tax=Paracoccus nototheniae TaxID=2489002 RepID=UPI001A954743
HATFSLTQDRKDLGFVKSRHLHQIPLRYLAEKILRPHPLSFGEDYRWPSYQGRCLPWHPDD